MPFVASILALCLLILFGFLISSNNKASKKEFDALQEKKDLDNRLIAFDDKLSNLEKRLRNVETIVTDVKFVDPPTSGREAIDLKSELTELKSIIKNLQK